MAKPRNSQKRLSHVSDQVAIDTESGHHHGLGFWPPPSSDEKDPLRWPRWVKILALLSTALFNFVANFAGAGLSTATTVLQDEFNKSPQGVNSLLTFNFLLLGIGNMVWVPLSVKLGKRPVLILSMALLFALLVWTAQVKTFEELLVARCLSGFASAAGESILPGVISDIFFLHERGAMMSIYVMLISSGSAIGPLIGGFMVQSSPETWRDFSRVCAAIAGFDLVAIFFLYPESSFNRPPVPATHHPLAQEKVVNEHKEEDDNSDNVENARGRLQVNHGNDSKDWVVSISYRQAWTSGFQINKRVNSLKAFGVPFIFLLSPLVIWAVFLYGCSLAAQIIMVFGLPDLLVAPPYLFALSSVGLMEIAAVIGFGIACYGGGYISDVITAHLIVRSRGTFVPEQRLISLVPGSLVSPVGCILLAFACAYQLHWVAIAFGFAMVSFGTVYAPNIALTYLIDCYTPFAQEILVVVNVFKNLVAFLFAYVAVDWVNSQGWIQVYMVMFMVVTLSMVLAIPVYFFGGKARVAFEKILVTVSLVP
ncbi:MFS transporter [Annulohypoxylon stygium]|nr:MFS transporter [Annulohypoxylon stygium]